MLTPTALNQAITAADELDTSGLRVECMCCHKFISGNPTALRTSHGMCKPLCANAIALGWSNPKPPVPTRDNPLAPLFQLL